MLDVYIYAPKLPNPPSFVNVMSGTHVLVQICEPASNRHSLLQMQQSLHIAVQHASTPKWGCYSIEIYTTCIKLSVSIYIYNRNMYVYTGAYMSKLYAVEHSHAYTHPQQPCAMIAGVGQAVARCLDQMGGTWKEVQYPLILAVHIDCLVGDFRWSLV